MWAKSAMADAALPQTHGRKLGEGRCQLILHNSPVAKTMLGTADRLAPSLRQPPNNNTAAAPLPQFFLQDFLVDFGNEPDGPVLAHEVRYPGEHCLACACIA